MTDDFDGATSPTEGEREDEILARLIAQGDAGALSQLIERHVNEMRLRAIEILGDDALAEGVAWQVFGWIWENRRDWRYRNVRSFLSNKARSLALHELRSEKARSERHRRWTADGRSPPQTPDDAFEHRQVRSALESAVKALPIRQREAFVLCEIEGFSYKRAAELMGVAPKTVEHYRERAISKLRNRLAPFLAEWFG